MPLIIVPPQINKYYFMDLTPDRSMVRYAVANGVQVFMISWKNPGPEQRDWDLDRYVKEVIGAMDVVAEITRTERVSLHGTCAGGLTAAATLGHLTKSATSALPRPPSSSPASTYPVHHWCGR